MDGLALNWRIHVGAVFFVIAATAKAAATPGCEPLTPAGLANVAHAHGGELELIFFSSWCTSCRSHLTATHSAETILIGTFDKKERLDDVIATLAVKTPCFFDQGIADFLGVNQLPTVLRWSAKNSKKPHD